MPLGGEASTQKHSGKNQMELEGCCSGEQRTKVLTKTRKKEPENIRKTDKKKAQRR